MDTNILKEIAMKLVSPGKGILAADESDQTIKKRFDAIGVESSPENHRIYRQLLFKTEGIEEFISGVILFDETVRQKSDEGITLPDLLNKKGIVPGIKVDMGTEEITPGSIEKKTNGFEGLDDRLDEYKGMGAQFTKWRAVFSISDTTPTDELISKNASDLARYARMAQDHNLVPIVEPEVLMDGSHSIKKCREVTYNVLKKVFIELSRAKVDIGGMLLKPNMVLPGKENSSKANPMEVAKATLEVLKQVLPDEMPGVVFLSGGQSPIEATVNLNEINKQKDTPWQLSFSYGRALQEPVLKNWGGVYENIEAAQKAFLFRARMNSLAREGKYSPDMENT
ncbi:MAG TPA: class I fructose-bisphosphate aldolase [Patescibacteria group bacterium]|nr:class I fructose-bisphosphate aldolase [Patescibacteria group bacterium]